MRRRVALTLAGMLALAAALATVAHAAGSVQGWLGNGTGWPQRALVLFAPDGAKVDPSTVHVTENGAKTGPLSVTPLTHAGPHDLGLVVVVDRGPSMAGQPLNAAMAAARQLAVSHSAGEPIRVIPFGGAGLPGAMQLGLTQLAHAHVAFGAIVVVSDGAGKLLSGPGPTPSAIRSAAAAANVPIFTVGVQDGAATARSLGGLHSVAGGQLVQAPPARLSSVFTEIGATVTRGYVVRWSSRARAGAAVDVRATLSGAANVVNATYAIPAPSNSDPAGSRRPLSKSDFSFAHQLATLPSFAVAPVARPISPAAPAPPTATTPSSFWNSQNGVLVIAMVVGLLLTVTLMLLLYRPSKRAVRTRVSSYLPAPEPEGDEELELLAAQKPNSGLIARFQQGRRWPAFVEDVEISGTVHQPGALVKRAAVAGLGLGLLIMLISGSALFGFIPILAWPWVLRKLYARKARKMRETFRDALPIYLQDLASAMRVGRSFVGALTAVAAGADEPLKSTFERAITDEALGRPLEEALDAAAERMQNSDLGQVALIAGLNRKSGSNVSEALDRVAEGARERADLRREIKALTAQAKMSSYVLTALPGLLLIGINLVSPLYAKPLFHTTIGIVLLSVGAMMVFGGWKVMSKITTVEA